MRQNAAMVTGGAGNDAVENGVLVRYWAGARAAAGVDKEIVPGPLTLSELLGEVVARHADRPRLKDVVSVCSVLVGDRPTGTSDPATVVLRPGDTVELLPPFAGG
jgi:molybdopterin converting factor small subunit